MPGRDIGRPGVDRRLQGIAPVRLGMDAVLSEIPGDRLGDLPVAQRCQGRALVRVVLSAVLVQVMDGARVAGHKGAQGAAGADRAELAVVTDEHQLGPGRFDMRGEADEVDVVGHAHLVEDHSGLFAEAQLAVVEPPDQAGQRPRLADLRFVGEVAGRLAGGGRAEHLEASLGERGGDHAQHGGLAGAGHAHDELGSPSGGADRDRRRPLLVRQLDAHRGLGPGDGRLESSLGHRWGVAAGELTPEALGDGGLPGEDRGERVDRLPRSRHPDERDRFRVGERPVDERVEERRVLAVQVRGEGDDHVTAGEHLAPGQVAVISQDLRHEPASLLERHRPDTSSGGVDRRGQALDGPAGCGQLGPPAAHELALCLVLLGPAGGAGGDTAGPVGRLAAALALGLDLGCPLRVQLHDLVGDAGDPPVPESARTGPGPPRSHSPARPLPGPPARRPTMVAACRCSRHSAVSAAFHPPRSSFISTRLASSTWSCGQGSPAREVAWRVWA